MIVCLQGKQDPDVQREGAASRQTKKFTNTQRLTRLTRCQVDASAIQCREFYIKNKIRGKITSPFTWKYKANSIKDYFVGRNTDIIEFIVYRRVKWYNCSAPCVRRQAGHPSGLPFSTDVRRCTSERREQGLGLVKCDKCSKDGYPELCYYASQSSKGSVTASFIEPKFPSARNKDLMVADWGLSS